MNFLLGFLYLPIPTRTLNSSKKPQFLTPEFSGKNTKISLLIFLFPFFGEPPGEMDQVGIDPTGPEEAVFAVSFNNKQLAAGKNNK